MAMNIKAWQWWLKQTPTNKLFSALAIALCVVWGLREKENFATTKLLRETVKDKNILISDYSNKLVKCEQDAAARERIDKQIQLDELSRQLRFKDSMYYAITAAQRAVKKAIDNDK